MKEEQEQVLAQLALRNSMHSAMTDDIVITGKKYMFYYMCLLVYF